MKRTFTKYPSSYLSASSHVNAYTIPSYNDASFNRYNSYEADAIPAGKVLIVSEDKDNQSANGYYTTTKYGDVYGSHSHFYLLTADGTLYSTKRPYRNYPYTDSFFESCFENGGFVEDFRDHWITVKHK